MRIALGSDHAGYELKTLLKSSLESWGHAVIDLGTDSASTPVDYPDYGAAVGRAVVSDEADHNHANVLCLGARLTGSVVAVETLDAWLRATPEVRHEARIEKLRQLDADAAMEGR
jgi:ribose 5-phosphate isomerase RpiB